MFDDVSISIKVILQMLVWQCFNVCLYLNIGYASVIMSMLDAISLFQFGVVASIFDYVSLFVQVSLYMLLRQCLMVFEVK